MADLAQHNVSGAHADETRRDFLILTATAIGAVGVAATIWPFIDSLNPARDTLALSTTEVDLAPVQVGQLSGHRKRLDVNNGLEHESSSPRADRCLVSSACRPHYLLMNSAGQLG